MSLSRRRFALAAFAALGVSASLAAASAPASAHPKPGHHEHHGGFGSPRGGWEDGRGHGQRWGGSSHQQGSFGDQSWGRSRRDYGSQPSYRTGASQTQPGYRIGAPHSRTY